VRGTDEQQVTMLSLVTPDKRVPADHPLRRIKALAEQALAALSPTFGQMYSAVGRPSIPPERLLKATQLMASHTLGLAIFASFATPCNARWFSHRAPSLISTGADSQDIFFRGRAASRRDDGMLLAIERRAHS